MAYVLDKMVESICSSCGDEFLSSLWAVLTASSQHRCAEKHLLWCWEICRILLPSVCLACQSSNNTQRDTPWSEGNIYPPG